MDQISTNTTPDTRSQSAEEGLWARFASSTETGEFAVLWLTLLCTRIDGIRSGLLLLGDTERGPFTPAAVWPVGSVVLHLKEAAEQTLRERRGLVVDCETETTESTCKALTYPLILDDALRGALVLEVPDLPPREVQEILRSIHWGIGSLQQHLYRSSVTSDDDAKERVFAVLDLVAIAVEEERFQGACGALVAELATRLDCDRVSLGFRRGNQLRVEAISHSATFGRQMNLTRLIEAAMDEAVDQQSVVRFPADEDGRITAAHQNLAQQQGAGEICTLPLSIGGAFDASLVLERPRGNPLSSVHLDLCQTVGEFACPMLLCKRDQERWLIRKAFESARTQLGRLLGAGYLGRKLVGLLLAVLIGFFSLATGTYRITADTTLEGGELRAVVVPFNGFIETAPIRAGEIVEAGQVLATLDNQDLKLEQVRLSTEQAQYRRERREAAAQHNRGQVRILTAKVEQAEAKLSLIDEQLARTRLTAPFDGLLVSGDLSQSLGAPVKQGDLLFEIAPSGQYRLQLRVDERDIDDVSMGQQGMVVLSALPDDPLPFSITLITPVAEVSDGRNRFQVEAMLDEVPSRLRPGMEGIGKIEVGERRLVWTWTRGFVHWLRLAAWTWWP